MIAWKSNYTKTDTGTVSYTHLTVRESSAEELYDVCAYLINEANTLRENLPEDENGVFPVSYTHLDVYKRQGHSRAGAA